MTLNELREELRNAKLGYRIVCVARVAEFGI